MSAVNQSSAFLMILNAGLTGTATVPVMKQILQKQAGLGFWKSHLEMVVAIMENRPIDVLKIGGSREFRDKEDKSVGEILVNCAVEMLMKKSETAPLVLKK